MNDYPWVNNYDEGVPHSLQPYSQETMIDVVDESAKARPYRALLFFKGSKVTYYDFVRQSDSLAAGLVARGIKKGDRVAMVLPNSPQMVIGFQGIWKAGAIAVPINPFYKQDELEHALREVDAVAVIVLNPFYAAVKDIQKDTGIKVVIATSIKEYMPAHLGLHFTLVRERKEGYRISLEAGDIWFQDLLRIHRNLRRPEVEVKPADPAVILFSDRAPGIPRGAVGTHEALIMTAKQISVWLSPALDTWDDRVLLTASLFHSSGCVGALGVAMINHSSCILISNPEDLTDVVKSIKQYEPAVAADVPTFYSGIMNHPLVKEGRIKLDSMRLCIVGGAPMGKEARKQLVSMTGGKVLEGYTITECMQASTLDPVLGVNKEGAFGLPLPDVVIRIADVESGDESLKAGEPGEICFKSPNLMLGYWNQPAETANMLKNGWLHTGDTGYLDEDGYLFLKGRIKGTVGVSESEVS